MTGKNGSFFYYESGKAGPGNQKNSLPIHPLPFFINQEKYRRKTCFNYANDLATYNRLRMTTTESRNMEEDTQIHRLVPVVLEGVVRKLDPEFLNPIKRLIILDEERASIPTKFVDKVEDEASNHNRNPHSLKAVKVEISAGQLDSWVEDHMTTESVEVRVEGRAISEAGVRTRDENRTEYDVLVHALRLVEGCTDVGVVEDNAEGEEAIKDEDGRTADGEAVGVDGDRARVDNKAGPGLLTLLYDRPAK